MARRTLPVDAPAASGLCWWGRGGMGVRCASVCPFCRAGTLCPPHPEGENPQELRVLGTASALLSLHS